MEGQQRLPGFSARLLLYQYTQVKHTEELSFDPAHTVGVPVHVLDLRWSCNCLEGVVNRCLDAQLLPPTWNLSGLHVNDAALAATMHRVQARITGLLIANCRGLGDGAVQALQECKLQTLDMARVLLSASAMQNLLANQRCLTYLDVSGCSGVDDALLILISHSVRDLRTLKAKGTAVADTGAAALLSRCKELQHLDLSSCKALRSIGVVHTDGTPMYLSTRLRALYLGGTQRVSLRTVEWYACPSRHS
jgi:hypothetical protein